jgi:hypothetical protein
MLPLPSFITDGGIGVITATGADAIAVAPNIMTRVGGVEAMADADDPDFRVNSRRRYARSLMIEPGLLAA